MKPTPTAQPEKAPILVFGAHPDDIEFGCGGVILMETRAGRKAHFVVCSKGEAASHGTPRQRKREAGIAASILGATLEFLELDGDSRLEMKASHVLALAEVIRRIRPSIVLAPTVCENQHPDHSRLGKLVRDATRVARYGGVSKLKSLKPHAGACLYFYAVGSEAEPVHPPPILIDISSPDIVAGWTAAMQAHASQGATRNYVELQLARARLHGLNSGLAYATPLYPNGSIVLGALSSVLKAGRS